MKLVERFWATINIVVSWLTLSPIESSSGLQYPIIPDIHNIPVVNLYNVDPELQYRQADDGGGPVFKPPTGRPIEFKGGDLECEYPTLGSDWYPCSTKDNRGCWLKNNVTGEEYNITTDYETKWPPGIIRNYTIVLSNKTINADGINFPFGKVFSFDFPNGKEFNGTFPGPWIQACWGDKLYVTVHNELPRSNLDTPDNANGTSIHWHGLRQHRSMHMDGVNGITQCPIAPGDHFTYNFTIMQYGSTWYHSHYSMQYADGTQGPMTLHGPTAGNFDKPLFPFILTDWGHNSAFRAVYPPGLDRPSIVLNGKGNVTRFTGAAINTTKIPDIHEVQFEPGKRYLLRIINTSFGTEFRFSVDGHKLEVVQHDLVPIESYITDSIVVHIGQRYNVIVQAKDASDDIGDGNFWIRTTICNPGAQGITPGDKFNYMKTGIVRYDNQSKADPTTLPSQDQQECTDHDHRGIKPIVPWQIGPSFNDLTDNENAELKFVSSNRNFTLSRWLWDIKEAKKHSASSFQINYSLPLFTRLEDPQPKPQEVVIYEDQKFTDKTWAYLVLVGADTHPIHLHGHDFAVVYESITAWKPGEININSTCPENTEFNCNNPSRRDVIMPKGGDAYTVIAFKTDNPGSWLLHCHIAKHAGGGLALQILERPGDAAAIWPSTDDTVVEAERVCNNWDVWWHGIHGEQDDSGI